MPQKTKSGDEYKRLRATLTSGQPGCLYIFHGEERYLLDYCLLELRSKLCPDGLSGFNYKRVEGKDVSIEELDNAINTFPVFAERTFIEIHDFDIFKLEKSLKLKLTDLFSDLPAYVCIVFVFSTVVYKPDQTVKLNKELLKNAEVVEFVVQDRSNLIKWITRHFADAGKQISPTDAEYLAFITGGYMTMLNGEIEKAAAYSGGETVTRADIDAVVTPVLDTAVYKLTDALTRRDHTSALSMLDELLQMQEPPHKLLFSISLKMRQLLAARVALDNNLGRETLMDMCGIRQEFMVKPLISTAQRMSLFDCCKAVRYCSETAYDLNSSSQPEAHLTDLVVRLAFNR